VDKANTIDGITSVMEGKSHSIHRTASEKVVSIFTTYFLSAKQLFLYNGYHARNFCNLTAAFSMTVEEVCVHTGLSFLYKKENRGRIIRELLISETVDATAMKFPHWVCFAGGYPYFRVCKIIRPLESDIDFFMMYGAICRTSVHYDHNHEPVDQVLNFFRRVLCVSFVVDIRKDLLLSHGIEYNNDVDYEVVIDYFGSRNKIIKPRSKIKRDIMHSMYWTHNRDVDGNNHNTIDNARAIRASIKQLMANRCSGSLAEIKMERMVLKIPELHLNIDVIIDPVTLTASDNDDIHNVPSNHATIVSRFDMNVCMVFVSPFLIDHRFNNVKHSVHGFTETTLSEIKDRRIRITANMVTVQYPKIVFDIKRVAKYLSRGNAVSIFPLRNEEITKNMKRWSQKFSTEEVQYPDFDNWEEVETFFFNNRRNIYHLVLGHDFCTALCNNELLHSETCRVEF
jgi:hypothetical protein